MVTSRYIRFTLVIYCLLFFQKGQALFSQPLPDISADTLFARNLINASDSLSHLEQYDSALTTLSQALPIYHRQGHWPQYISVYVNMAVLCDYLEEEKKEKYASLAVEEGEKHLPKEHPVLARAYHQKAEALTLLGQFPEAIPYLHRAIPVFQEHRLWESEAWAVLLLANIYYKEKENDSLRHYLESINPSIQQHDLNQDIKGTFYQLYGALFMRTRDYEKAIEVAQHSLDILLKESGINSMDSAYIAQYFHNIGFMHSYKGDYLRALDNYFKALSWQSGQSNHDKPLNYYRIGAAYFNLSDYPNAILYLRKSLEASSKENLVFLKEKYAKKAWNTLAECFLEMGDLELAQKSLNQAKAIPTHIDDHLTWELLGELYLKHEEIDAAIISLETAIEILEASRESLIFLPRVYTSLGNAFWKKGNSQKALEYYQKGIAAATFYPNHSDLYSTPSLENVHHPVQFLKSVHAKAKALKNFQEDSKALPSALATYQIAVQWIDSLRGKYVTDQSELSWGKSFKKIYEEAMEVAWKLYDKTKDKQHLWDMFVFSEKSKASLLLETLKAHQEQTTIELPDSLRTREKDLAMEIAYYHQELKKAQDSKDSTKRILFQTYLSEKQLAMARHKEWMQKAYPVTLPTSTETRLEEIQHSLLDDKTALVTYFVGKKSPQLTWRTYAVVITQHGIDATPLQIDSVTLVAFQEALRHTPANSAAARELYPKVNQRSYDAYREIFAPVAGLLSPEIKKLIIIPDGILNRLPFEVLNEKLAIGSSMNFGSLPYLLKRYPIRYGYSAALLLNNQYRTLALQANKRVLAFAPPYEAFEEIASRSKGGSTRGNATPLKGTSGEVRAISQYFNGRFETTEAATVDVFRQKASKFGVLHLAMHGKADFSRRGFAYLIFSNIHAASIEDAKLYNYEISQLDLAAQLVVLSACETGVGQYLDGEGVFSLARGFMNAGVPSVVMSLWQVNDLSTSELMPVFYKHLADGLPKDEALYQAKLDFVTSSDPLKTHPFYWSGFVLLGDEAPIGSKGMPWYFWLGFAFLGVLGAGWLYRKSR